MLQTHAENQSHGTSRHMCSSPERPLTRSSARAGHGRTPPLPQLFVSTEAISLASLLVIRASPPSLTMLGN